MRFTARTDTMPSLQGGGGGRGALAACHVGLMTFMGVPKPCRTPAVEHRLAKETVAAEPRSSLMLPPRRSRLIRQNKILNKILIVSRRVTSQSQTFRLSLMAGCATAAPFVRTCSELFPKAGVRARALAESDNPVLHCRSCAGLGMRLLMCARA